MNSNHLWSSPSSELQRGGLLGGYVSTSRTWALILREFDSAKAESLAMKNITNRNYLMSYTNISIYEISIFAKH